MLTITIPSGEFYNHETKEFINVKAQTIQLEHSLVSLAKWESQWKKPLMGTDEKTKEETLDYVRCMTITQNIDPIVYSFIPDSVVNEITEYMKEPMTATTFREDLNRPKSREIITAELIYYWMVSLNIPFECQKWHLNRLLTLIRVCNIKNTPPKKMNAKDAAARQRALNEERRRKLNTKG